MGNHFEIIVDRDVSAAEAPRLAERLRAWFIDREIIEAIPAKSFLNAPAYRPGPAYSATLKEPNPHGNKGSQRLHFKVGRTLFCSTDLRLTCRACAARLNANGDWWDEALDEALNAWVAGDDSVTYACPQCKSQERLTEWDGDAPWGFGHLGLEFWDWWPLSERFIQEVTEQLGHRTRVVRGKL